MLANRIFGWFYLLSFLSNAKAYFPETFTPSFDIRAVILVCKIAFNSVKFYLCFYKIFRGSLFPGHRVESRGVVLRCSSDLMFRHFGTIYSSLFTEMVERNIIT